MSSPIDFESLFDIAPNAYMVVDAELRYVAANAAYLDVTASPRERLLGRHLFDLFPNDPNDPNNVPAQMLRKSLERVLATGERDHLAYIPYRVPKKVGDAVVEVDRYWSATHCPVRDAAGRVTLILQHTVDVTDLYEREAAARAPEGSGEAARSRAGVLARARAVQEENARVEAEREHLRVLFEQAPGFMCFLEGRDHVFRLANDAYVRLVGGRDLLGRPVREALPEVVAQGFQDLLDRVFDSGEPYLGEGVPLMLQRRPDAEPEEVFVDFVYQPVRGADGRSRGIFVQGHDVTQRVRAELEREAARRAAEAFSDELKEQSRAVTSALEAARRRIAELEASLAGR
jgi:PAS domain S-box-containing protein